MTEPGRNYRPWSTLWCLGQRNAAYGVILLVVLFVTAALGFGLTIASRIAVRHEPMAEATQAFRFELASAHLWLEEALDGSPAAAMPDQARFHIIRARAYLDTMRFGGVTPEGEGVPPPEEPDTAVTLERMDVLMGQFEALLAAHFEAPPGERPSGLEAATDYVFAGLIRAAAALHALSQHKVDGALADFRSDLVALLITSFAVAAAALLYVRRVEALRARQRRALEREVAERREVQAGLDRAQAIAHLGHWEWTPHSGALVCSDETLRILGLKPGHAPQWLRGYAGLLAAVHPDDRSVLAARVRDLRDGAEPTPLDHRVLRPDGGVRYVRAQLALVGEGEAERVVGTLRDITDARLAEAAAVASEARYHRLFDSMAQGMIVYDADARVVAANPAAAAMLGSSPERLAGCGVEDPLLGVTREDGSVVSLDECPVMVALRTRVPVPPQVLGFTLREGEPPRWLTVSATPYLAGPTPEVQVSLTDITEQRRLEEAYRSARRMEALGTLVGGIAHDFNNILTSLQGTLHLARRRVGDEQALLDKLDTAEQLGQRAADMVAQLLAFSRQRKIALGECDFTRVVAEAVRAAGAGMAEGVAIGARLPDNALTVRGDHNLLQQVVVNLLFNARDATAGRPKPTITVTLETVDGAAGLQNRHPDLQPGRLALLAVSDNGVGIPPEHMERLFEPFFTTKEVGRGTGLGLAMCYGTVRAHGGAMEVESHEGQGTTFRVMLPVVAVQSAGRSRHEPLPPPRARPGETILLADDEDLVRLTAREVLQDLGYKVVDAADGEAACDLFDSDPDRITLAFVDVVMPRRGGVDAVRHMRERRPDLPVIFTTGYDRHRVLSDADDWQPFTVLPKPYAMGAIGWRVRAMIDGEPSAALAG